VIDLHLHTTASDGRLPPADLVRRAASAGITALAITDHDTVNGLAEGRAEAALDGVTFVTGIELTAVHEARDVHILGYYFDPADAGLAAFLTEQRAVRVDRVREIGDRLSRLGAPVDIESLLAWVAERPGASVGRPAIARALLDAGHVASLQDAFDRLLATGQPAFVPRRGPGPQAVVDVVHGAGGIASMAHPGLTRQPGLLEALVAGGLDGVEVYHSDHTPPVRAELASFAARHRLLVTGGSDYHGDDGRDRPLGGVTLPAMDFARLEEAAARRHRP
jgi:predicted metal-dependent phosphoesterase TrpH